MLLTTGSIESDLTPIPALPLGGAFFVWAPLNYRRDNGSGRQSMTQEPGARKGRLRPARGTSSSAALTHQSQVGTIQCQPGPRLGLFTSALTTIIRPLPRSTHQSRSGLVSFTSPRLNCLPKSFLRDTVQTLRVDARLMGVEREFRFRVNRLRTYDFLHRYHDSPLAKWRAWNCWSPRRAAPSRNSQKRAFT